MKLEILKALIQVAELLRLQRHRQLYPSSPKLSGLPGIKVADAYAQIREAIEGELKETKQIGKREHLLDGILYPKGSADGPTRLDDNWIYLVPDFEAVGPTSGIRESCEKLRKKLSKSPRVRWIKRNDLIPQYEGKPQAGRK